MVVVSSVKRGSAKKNYIVFLYFKINVLFLFWYLGNRRSVKYSDEAREILAIIIDCTMGSSFLEYAKSIVTTILQHYHEQADVRMF